MTETTYHPQQTRLERVMGALNVLPKFVLRLPFQTPMSRRLILLRYTGRKSGRSYTVPVSYVEQGDTLLIPGGGGWKKTSSRARRCVSGCAGGSGAPARK